MADLHPMVAAAQGGALTAMGGRDALQARLGHVFGTDALLDEALRHRSALAVRRQGRNSNERLEFVGDRVLGLLIAEWLIERFPKEREGDLGKRLAALVSRDAVATVAEEMDLGSYLTLLAEEAKAGVAARRSVLADALEAVLGALYLDGGLEAARRFVRTRWAAQVEGMAAPPVAPKSRLQEWSLARGLGLPVYRLVSTEGPPHRPVFRVEARLGETAAEGSGVSKQAAETEAAAALFARVSGK